MTSDLSLGQHSYYPRCSKEENPSLMLPLLFLLFCTNPDISFNPGAGSSLGGEKFERIEGS